ncbi:hypothetical protein ABIA39_007724 [Nocardia sp. GAS34]
MKQLMEQPKSRHESWADTTHCLAAGALHRLFEERNVR